MLWSKLKTAMAILFLAALMSAAGAMYPTQPAEQPKAEQGKQENEGRKKAAPKDKMFPDGCDYNFGDVKRGTHLQRDFRIINTSPNLPLTVIAVRVSSGCTTAAIVDKHSLTPKKKAN